MGGIFSGGQDSSPPPEPVRTAVSAPTKIVQDKVSKRDADSIRQKRRARLGAAGRSTVLTGAMDEVSGDVKTLLGS